MEYKIITDRGEIERLAEDTFLSDDKMITLIDYADLRALRRSGTFKHAIICNFDIANRDWFEDFKSIITSAKLSFDNLNAFYINIIEGGNKEDSSLPYRDVMKLRDYLITIRCSGECIDYTSEDFTSCLWVVKNRPTLPKGTLQIQLMSTYEKTEQDRADDEKYERMIEEYRNENRPPIKINCDKFLEELVLENVTEE